MVEEQSQKVQQQNRPQKEGGGFYYWLKNPKWTMPFKFLFIGMFLTSILLLRFIDAGLILVGGFFVRETYLLMVNPEYKGSKLLR